MGAMDGKESNSFTESNWYSIGQCERIVMGVLSSIHWPTAIAAVVIMLVLGMLFGGRRR
jgi:hypothetical protein